MTPIVTWGQLSRPHVDFVNEEILFLNESIHGLLVAHRIYEGYNQTINKYVDLPSFEINNYSNKDLPDNIFEDPEKWFYDRSPKSVYRALLVDKRRKELAINGWPLIAQINTRTEFVNGDRSKIDKIINRDDINEISNVQTVYQELEKAIGHYDKVRDDVATFEKSLFQSYMAVDISQDKKQVYTALVDLHFDVKLIVRQIRKDNQSGVIQSLSKIEKEINWLTACINKLKDSGQIAKLKRIRDLIGNLKNDIKSYVNTSKLPEEYAVFGKGYYYHNVKLLTQINRYGNGYVSELNTFFKKSKWPVIHFIEEPHFLSVVYPERIDVETLMSPDVDPQLDIKTLITPNLPAMSELVVATNTSVPVESSPIESNNPAEAAAKESGNNPTSLEKAAPAAAKPLVIIGTHTILVDSLTFEIELFDHKKKDGDRVSINVNGEWVHNNISLEKKTQKLKLSIKPGGQNYIMIRADNTGWMPPNTIGIKYLSKSQRLENVFLQQDLQENEVIKINYQQG